MYFIFLVYGLIVLSPILFSYLCYRIYPKPISLLLGGMFFLPGLFACCVLKACRDENLVPTEKVLRLYHNIIGGFLIISFSISVVYYFIHLYQVYEYEQEQQNIINITNLQNLQDEERRKQNEIIEQTNKLKCQREMEIAILQKQKDQMVEEQRRREHEFQQQRNLEEQRRVAREEQIRIQHLLEAAEQHRKEQELLDVIEQSQQQEENITLVEPVEIVETKKPFDWQRYRENKQREEEEAKRKADEIRREKERRALEYERRKQQRENERKSKTTYRVDSF